MNNTDWQKMGVLIAFISLIVMVTGQQSNRSVQIIQPQNNNQVIQSINMQTGNAYSNGGAAISNTNVVNNISSQSMITGNNSTAINTNSNVNMINHSKTNKMLEYQMQKMQRNLKKQQKNLNTIWKKV